MAEKKTVGRPTAYKAEYCNLMIAHMEQGLSFESFAGAVGVVKQTLYDWCKVYPEFQEAKDIALERSRIFWEKLGITHIVNQSDSEYQGGSSSRSLNASVWIFNMKNRFGWRDKQPDEVDVIVNNNAAQKSDEEIDAKIQELMAKQQGN